MDNAMRNALEQYADALESCARTDMFKEHKKKIELIAPRMKADLFSIAWEIKQIARWGTTSFGV